MIDCPKVAFVDDEASVLSGLRRALRGKQVSWDMTFHDDPVAAYDAMCDDPPHVAVVDIRMPVMDGVELAKRIRTTLPSTQTIVLSGSTEFDIAISMINDGNIFRFYVKPCPVDQLMEGVEAAIAHRMSLAGEAQGKAEDIGASALDNLPFAVLVTNADGMLLFANQSGGELIAKRIGLTVDRAGILRAVRPEDTDRLHLAMRGARDTQTAVGLRLDDEQGAPVRATILAGEGADPSVESGASDANRLYLYVSRDGTAPNPQPELIAALFGLTVSESRLAAAMAQGLNLDEAASECGVTKSTARTYLKNIFSKTGATRQAELVRKILLSVASR